MTHQFSDGELAAIREVMLAADIAVDATLRARPLAGGRSNLTVVLEDDTSRWVLRTPPRQGRTPSAHDVVREYRVTRALAQHGVAVARPVAVSEDEALIGGPFAIWEFVDGVSVQRRDALDALGDENVETVVDALVSTLAHLHSLDHCAIGLERFGQPHGYYERQLRRWGGQWDLVAPDAAPLRRAAEELRNSLAQRVPVQTASSVVHGDYRIDNVLLRTDGRTASIAAVVDWELSTIGDPVADVAMMCAYRHEAFDDVLGFETAWASDRLPSPSVLAERYERSGGVPLSDFGRHMALACFKIATISAGIDFRFRAEGGGDDAVGRTAHAAVGPYLTAGLDALR